MIDTSRIDLRLKELEIMREQMGEARKLWAKGLDTADIAHMIGVHESTVYNHLNLIRRSTHGRNQPNLRVVS